MADVTINQQSNIVRHVPSRARSSDEILEYAKKHSIINEMLIKVGLRMNRNLIVGSNHRCVAMLTVYKSFMDELSSDLKPEILAKPYTLLQESLNKALEFLDFCRPLSVSMKNSHKLLNEEISNFKQENADKSFMATSQSLFTDEQWVNTSTDQTQQQQQQQQQNVQKYNQDTSTMSNLATSREIDSDLFKNQLAHLKNYIDTFIEEEIWAAQRGICENIDSNIISNDVILVYGCSTIVQHVLLHAKARGKTFSVIVVDSSPHFNGRRMLNFLNEHLINVTYTLINSLSFVMRQATKVLLGANSILANGYVMSQIGTSQVALMARALNKPTLVCCETYKLSDKVYVDSFVCNEVDNRKGLSSALNLRYDLTPPEFVSMVINEKSTIPAIAVPALLRFRAEKTKTSSLH